MIDVRFATISVFSYQPHTSPHPHPLLVLLLLPTTVSLAASFPIYFIIYSYHFSLLVAYCEYTNLNVWSTFFRLPTLLTSLISEAPQKPCTILCPVTPFNGMTVHISSHFSRQNHTHKAPLTTVQPTKPPIGTHFPYVVFAQHPNRKFTYTQSQSELHCQ